MRRGHLTARRVLVLAAALGVALVASACSTRPAGPIDRPDLQAAESFPYYRLYWAGPIFDAIDLTAADGRAGYIDTLGSSLYYGDCDAGKGILKGGGCVLPLQITTVHYIQHSNQALGPGQRNVLIRGVPAVIFQGGRAIELYTGKLAVDILADNPQRAYRAAQLLRPINAPGDPYERLPAPDFCPGLWGPHPGYKVARAPDGRLDCVDAAAQLGTTAALPIGAPEPWETNVRQPSS